MNDNGGVFVLVFLAGFMIAHLITLSMSQTYYRLNIIERGYGLYCPTDGDFAFIEECIE